LSGVLPRKFKIAFEGCAEDHAVTAINDIGWRARIVDGRKGWKVTVAGGTSILPVSGYVLYEFLPVEQMLEVAEAIVRVFHKYGDFQHPQRNDEVHHSRDRVGAYRAHFEEELEAFRREGGARPARSTPRR
jgi:sulfite reductase (NADPH) hemoprotein beta-component